MLTKFKTVDLWLILLPLFLCSISVAVLASITINTGGALATRQLLFIGLGWLLYFVFAFTDYRALRAWAGLFYLASLVFLILVRFLGTVEFGAKRWIDFGFFRFQPSELVKLAVILVLAALFANRINRVHSRRLFFAFLLVFIPAVVTLIQPDLGSALTILLLGIGLIFHTGLSSRQWLAISSLGLIVGLIGVLAWKGILPFKYLIKDYQRTRIATFIHPEADPSGAGYNILQATIAVGSGGLFGKGLGFGSQSQLNFLPVSHTDFIFASLSESWGFVGSFITLLIYTVLLFRVIGAARIAKDDFSLLLCSGVALFIFVQVLINVGMNLRLAPVTGLTLPLISYGGSSVLVTLAALGMVQSVIIREKRITFG